MQTQTPVPTPTITATPTQATLFPTPNPQKLPGENSVQREQQVLRDLKTLLRSLREPRAFLAFRKKLFASIVECEAPRQDSIYAQSEYPLELVLSSFAQQKEEDMEERFAETIDAAEARSEDNSRHASDDEFEVTDSEENEEDRQPAYGYMRVQSRSRKIQKKQLPSSEDA